MGKKPEGNGIGQLLLDAGMHIVETEKLLREVTFRCNLALPTSEEELEWFEEGCDRKKSGDFALRLFKRLGIGEGICEYCGGSGYDPHPNHDTTMRPCPECSHV